MSRFYEVLKQASHAPGTQPPPGPVKSPPGVFSASGITLPPLSELPSEPEISPLKEEKTDKPNVAAVGARPERVQTETFTREPASRLNEEFEQELLKSFAPDSGPIGTTVAPLTLQGDAHAIPQALAPSVVEHYRKLRTKILQQQTLKPFRSLVIASPNPQEGKTVTVMNLGFSFAMLPSFKVLIVDGDLRKGGLGRCLGLDDRLGFSNLLDGSATLADVVLKSDDNPLHFITRGTSKAPAAELLHTPELASHFRQMAEHFDIILVDSPPVSLITDTQLLAGACDAVLLLARSFVTSRKSFEKAQEELQSFRLIGTVLNGGTRPRRSSSSYYYHQYGGSK